jgi:hypothetical protein
MRRLLTLVLAVTVLVPLAGCGKKKPKPAVAEATPNASPAPSGGGGGGGGGNTNYSPGAGAVQNVRQAGRRTVALNDFHQLGLAIKQVEILEGMPDKQRILAEVRTYPNLPAAINEGVIILTGTKDPAGLWAYEVDADTKGGIVLVGGTASRATADEVQQHLARLPDRPAPPKTKGALDATPAPQPKPQPAPAGPAVTRQDLEDVRIFIDNASGASGQMPPPVQVLAALQQAQSPAAGLVQKGAIVLTGARTREAVWAYEAAALQRGGLAAGPNGVETLTAAALKQRLAASR